MVQSRLKALAAGVANATQKNTMTGTQAAIQAPNKRDPVVPIFQDRFVVGIPQRDSDSPIRPIHSVGREG
jgi:hypothetical protein